MSLHWSGKCFVGGESAPNHLPWDQARCLVWLALSTKHASSESPTSTVVTSACLSRICLDAWSLPRPLPRLPLRSDLPSLMLLDVESDQAESLCSEIIDLHSVLRETMSCNKNQVLCTCMRHHYRSCCHQAPLSCSALSHFLHHMRSVDCVRNDLDTCALQSKCKEVSDCIHAPDQSV